MAIIIFITVETIQLKNANLMPIEFGCVNLKLGLKRQFLYYLHIRNKVVTIVLDNVWRTAIQTLKNNFYIIPFSVDRLKIINLQ